MKVEHVLPISHPSPGAAGKTGMWRVVKPVVDESKCVGCGTCSTFCPENVVKIIDGKVVIDYEYCKGCGICCKVCPVGAINTVYEG